MGQIEIQSFARRHYSRLTAFNDNGLQFISSLSQLISLPAAYNFLLTV